MKYKNFQHISNTFSPNSIYIYPATEGNVCSQKYTCTLSALHNHIYISVCDSETNFPILLEVQALSYPINIVLRSQLYYEKKPVTYYRFRSHVICIERID